MVHRTACCLAVYATLIGFAALPLVVEAGGEGWTHDIAKAMETAAADEKHILMDFTGSDWCGYCIKLNQEIFSQDGFKEESAPKRFVLVEFDFPRDKSKLSEETIAQNEQWREKLEVRGFPTIFLATADGKPYAQTGYRRNNSPEDYVAHLSELQEAKDVSDEALAKAEKAEGKAKAKLLDEVIAHPSILVDGRDKLIDQIIELDADNELGLKQKYEAIRLQQQIAAETAEIRNLAFRGNVKQALTKLEALLEKHQLEGEAAQRVMIFKIQLLVYAAKPAEALGIADEVIELAPDSQTAALVNRLKPRLEKMVAAAAAAADAEAAGDDTADDGEEPATDDEPSKSEADDTTAAEPKP